MRTVRATMLALAALLVTQVPQVHAARVVMQQSGEVTAVHSGGHTIDVGGQRYKLVQGVKVHDGAGSTQGLGVGALEPGTRIGFDATGGRHPVITEIWVLPPKHR